MTRHDDNPTEDLEAEGLPAQLYDSPPGIDVETDSEWMMAPREHSLASGSDPAYPNTVEENRHPESVAARAARELPDFGAEDGLRRVEDDEGEGDEDDDALRRIPVPRLLQRALLGEEDLEGGAVAEAAEDDYFGESPEELAMHLGGEQEADDLDPLVERQQYLEGR